MLMIRVGGLEVKPGWGQFLRWRMAKMSPLRLLL
jgi:hypothetical protein